MFPVTEPTSVKFVVVPSSPDVASTAVITTLGLITLAQSIGLVLLRTGATVSTLNVQLAWVAALPAASLTSTVTVCVPSPRPAGVKLTVGGTE